MFTLNFRNWNHALNSLQFLIAVSLSNKVFFRSFRIDVRCTLHSLTHGEKNTLSQEFEPVCVEWVRMRSAAQGLDPAQSREWDRRHMRRPPEYSPGPPHSYEPISA